MARSRTPWDTTRVLPHCLEVWSMRGDRVAASMEKHTYGISTPSHGVGSHVSGVWIPDSDIDVLTGVMFVYIPTIQSGGRNYGVVCIDRETVSSFFTGSPKQMESAVSSAVCSWLKDGLMDGDITWFSTIEQAVLYVRDVFMSSPGYQAHKNDPVPLGYSSYAPIIDTLTTAVKGCVGNIHTLVYGGGGCVNVITLRGGVVRLWVDDTYDVRGPRWDGRFFGNISYHSSLRRSITDCEVSVARTGYTTMALEYVPLTVYNLLTDAMDRLGIKERDGQWEL